MNADLDNHNVPEGGIKGLPAVNILSGRETPLHRAIGSSSFGDVCGPIAAVLRFGQVWVAVVALYNAHILTASLLLGAVAGALVLVRAYLVASQGMDIVSRLTSARRRGARAVRPLESNDHWLAVNANLPPRTAVMQVSMGVGEPARMIRRSSHHQISKEPIEPGNPAQEASSSPELGKAASRDLVQDIFGSGDEHVIAAAFGVTTRGLHSGESDRAYLNRVRENSSKFDPQESGSEVNANSPQWDAPRAIESRGGVVARWKQNVDQPAPTKDAGT